jgi:Uma2 family endonuclease
MLVMLEAAMRRANVRFTYSDYLQLPEDNRYEILDGEIYVVPAPNIRHQRLSKRIVGFLIRQIEETGHGEILPAPCDVVFSDENVVQPDILFVRKERLGIIGEANIREAPDLVVEILSPGTRGRDLEIKRKLYARFGVQEYWIVDPEAATVEVLVWSDMGYASAGVYCSRDRLLSPLLPELNLPVAEIFKNP